MQATSSIEQVSTLADLRDHRFAVSGASGFIGRHLVSLLHERGAQVVMLRRPGSPTAPFTPARSHVVDFTDTKACAAALRRLKPTHIIHLAGYANSDRSPESIARSLDVNLTASMKLILGSMDAVPDTRVVVSGTLETSSPWRDVTEVGSPYGISKAMLEVLAGGLQRLYGANVVNARIGMVYGPDDPNEHRLVPSVISAFLRGQAPVLSSGRRRCDWVYVGDVAQALLQAATLRRIDEPSFDVGSGRLTSIRRVVELIRSHLGAPLDPVFSDELDRPNEQERCADADKTFRVTGWRAQTSLTEGLLRTIAWHKRVAIDESSASALVPQFDNRSSRARPPL
ncbi:MAG: NAD-dependent epimerase/dehydratase family protein [Burkholderiaceae bacterium]|nr:NAD-dependent epimerase/dehydratase family protein [Burkholderiaceae bacterium]